MGLFGWLSFGRSIFDKYKFEDIEKATQIIEHEDEVVRLEAQKEKLGEMARAGVEKRIQNIHKETAKLIDEIPLNEKQIEEIKQYLRRIRKIGEARKSVES